MPAAGRAERQRGPYRCRDYLILLLGNATRPPAFSDNQRAAVWLRAHHLSYGLGTWWRANTITADTGDHLRVRPVALRGAKLWITSYESVGSWYDPTLHYANFFVTIGSAKARAPRPRSRPCLWAAVFGPPVHAYQVGDLVVLVWHKNLLDTRFEHSPPVPPQSIAAGPMIDRRA